MRTLVSSLILALWATVSAAQVPSDVVRVELLPGWRQADGTHMAGLRILLAPGWKTYWRAPGEGGIPPRFDWSGSGNLAGAAAHFPTPDVFHLNGVRTIGYADAVVLPLALQTRDAGAPIDLRGRIELGVCETVCVPYEVRVDTALPANGSHGAREIRAALADAPVGSARGGVRGVDCRVEPITDGLRLSANLTMPRLGRDETAAVELSDPTIWVSEVEASRRGDVLTAEADFVPPHGKPFALDRSSLRFTVLAEGRAVEIRGCG